MKQLLADFHQEHPRLEVIFIEDALGAKGPYLRCILAIGAHFIVNVFWEKLRMYVLEFYVDSWAGLYSAMGHRREVRFVELINTS